MKTSIGNPFNPKARQLKSAIQFLRQLDVPAPRIASLLGTTADNLRHLDSRSYVSEELVPPPPLDELLSTYLPDPEHWAKLRDLNRSAVRNRQNLDFIDAAIERIKTKCGTALLVTGYESARQLFPYVSTSTRLPALRTRAKLEELLAFFTMHLGHSKSSRFYATEAMMHWLWCYDQSFGSKEYLLSYASSAMFRSNALLVSHNPVEAIETLRLAYDARLAAGERPNSEWFRQLATALLQHRDYDGLSCKLYIAAGREMESSPEIVRPVDIQMNGDRQQNLLVPKKGFERALQLIDHAKRDYGEYSLQHVIATNWAAAVAFRIDGCVLTGQELLQDLIHRNLPLEHQGTITKLLSITPRLNLRGENLDRWIRFALYETAAKSK